MLLRALDHLRNFRSAYVMERGYCQRRRTSLITATRGATEIGLNKPVLQPLFFGSLHRRWPPE
jgi:hypothetical protein